MSVTINQAISLVCMRRPTQVRKVAEDNGVDVSDQIKELEGRAAQVRCCNTPCAAFALICNSLANRRRQQAAHLHVENDQCPEFLLR